MKTKSIILSLGAIFILTVILLLKNQEVAPPDTTPSKVAQLKSLEIKSIPTEKLESKKEEGQKVSSLGKMPDPADKTSMEAFYAKASAAWNEKVANLIINDLKLGQDALDKYFSIRDEYYQSQFSLLQVQTSQEPDEKRNEEGGRRLASAMKNAKEILEKDYGINLDKDDINIKEDFPKISQAIQKAVIADSAKFHTEKLNQVKDVLGNDGFKKYDKMRNDFNNEITEEGAEAPFKI